jgi:hypothetical protein
LAFPALNITIAAMAQDDGKADLFLGVFLGMSVGFCLLGLAAAILWGIFPDYAPNLRALIEM